MIIFYRVSVFNLYVCTLALLQEMELPFNKKDEIGATELVLVHQRMFSKQMNFVVSCDELDFFCLS